MHIGVSLPHHAIGPDPVAIRDWAQAADDLGIDHLIVATRRVGLQTGILVLPVHERVNCGPVHR